MGPDPRVSSFLGVVVRGCLLERRYWARSLCPCLRLAASAAVFGRHPRPNCQRARQHHRALVCGLPRLSPGPYGHAIWSSWTSDRISRPRQHLPLVLFESHVTSKHFGIVHPSRYPRKPQPANTVIFNGRGGQAWPRRPLHARSCAIKESHPMVLFRVERRICSLRPTTIVLNL